MPSPTIVVLFSSSGYLVRMLILFALFTAVGLHIYEGISPIKNPRAHPVLNSKRQFLSAKNN